MLLTDVDIAEIVESVWSGMLGFPLAAADGHPATDGYRHIGTVQVTGGWEGAIVVECPEALGRQVAAAMFGLEPTDIGDDELADVIGELANMIGGNVKAALPGETNLSLPTVVRGRDFRVAVPGAELLRSVAYVCEGECFEVRVLSKIGT